MNVLPFLAIAATSGTLSLVLRSSRGWSTAIAVAGLIAMVATAASMTTVAVEVGGTVLAASPWLRLYAILASVIALGLITVDVAATHERDVPTVLVIGIGSAVLALALEDPGVAVMAATAGGLAGVLVAAPVGAAARAAFVGVRELRAVAIAGTLAILATAWLARPIGDLAATPAVFGLAYLAFGAAVAIRFGAIPFHLWAARVADAAPGIALPLLMAWVPAAFAAVGLVWIERSVLPVILPLATERGLIAAVGTISIVFGLVAAWIQDDLEHVVGYSIVADAGVAVLGLSILGPAAWEPARTWLLVFVVGRSAFAAWVVAVHGGFGTRRLPDLQGWARRAPVLAVSLGLIAAASIGWPGFVAWEARSSLIDLSLPRAIAILVTIAPLGAAAIYGRILVVGLALPGNAVSEGRGERPRWPTEVGERPRWPTAMPRRPVLGIAGLERAFERSSHVLAAALDMVWTLPAAGRANRIPVAAVSVLLLSGLAFVVAGGGLGVPEAARAAAVIDGGGPSPRPPEPSRSATPASSGAAVSGEPTSTAPSFAPVP
jgi:formate hydrogenlyase subunit 3/multisubunit Na+/H+ antiporter MnhD subunit